MASPSKVVADYLMNCVDLSNPETLIDRIQEINEAYETVPEEVMDAKDELSSKEWWEIIRKIAVRGKAQD